MGWGLGSFNNTHNWSQLLEQYISLSVLGDGNCFYRAVSRALCGNESFYTLLRLKTAVEIIVNRKYYDIGRRSYVDLICDNRIIVSDYKKKLVEDTVTLGSYSEMIHIYAVSAVLNTPIRSFYPPQIQPELAPDVFSRMVVGRNVRGASSSNIDIMWTQMYMPQNVRRFSPNHFVTLREIGKATPVQVVDKLTLLRLAYLKREYNQEQKTPLLMLLIIQMTKNVTLTQNMN